MKKRSLNKTLTEKQCSKRQRGQKDDNLHSRFFCLKTFLKRTVFCMPNTPVNIVHEKHCLETFGSI